MSSPHFLIIQTAQNDSYVILCNDQKEILKKNVIANLQQSALINQAIDDLFKDTEEGLSISAIGVNNGPGSYTGLRVGLATAKGLALGWGVPVVLHNYLELLACNHFSENQQSIFLKARDNEFFTMTYTSGKVDMPAEHQMLPHILENEIYKGQGILTDDEGLMELFPDITLLDKDIERALVEKTVADYQSGRFADLAYAEPYYLKPTYVTKSKK